MRSRELQGEAVKVADAEVAAAAESEEVQAAADRARHRCQAAAVDSGRPEAAIGPPRGLDWRHKVEADPAVRGIGRAEVVQHDLRQVGLRVDLAVDLEISAAGRAVAAIDQVRTLVLVPAIGRPSGIDLEPVIVLALAIDPALAAEAGPESVIDPGPATVLAAVVDLEPVIAPASASVRGVEIDQGAVIALALATDRESVIGLAGRRVEIARAVVIDLVSVIALAGVVLIVLVLVIALAGVVLIALVVVIVLAEVVLIVPVVVIARAEIVQIGPEVVAGRAIVLAVVVAQELATDRMSPGRRVTVRSFDRDRHMAAGMMVAGADGTILGIGGGIVVVGR